MFKSAAFDSEKPTGPPRAIVAWQAIDAAADGDVAGLRRLLDHDPDLFNKQRGYSLPFYFAVRENQIESVRLLLDSGADPAALGIGGEDLVTVARDRNLDEMAQMLEEACSQRGRERPADEDHPIHLAASANKARRVKALLDQESHLIGLVDRAGGTPLHRAVAASATAVVKLLLDRGADLHALHGDGHGSASGYAAAYLQPIDLALWSDHYWGVHGDVPLARTDAEDRTEKATVTPGPLAPARELYGALLLERDLAKEALAAYEAAMAKEPNRYHGLAGAAKAAERLGNKEKARAYYERLVSLTSGSESDRRELTAARQFLAKN